MLDGSGKIDPAKIEKYIDIEPYTSSDTNKDHWKVLGFDYKGLLGSKSFQNAYVAPAEKALTDQWKAAMDGKVVALGNAVAEASQNTPTAAEAATNYTSNTAGANRDNAVPMAAVKDVAEWVTAQQQQWLKDTEAELADVSGRLASELDKIAPKTELRLGGTDRFETAQLIANQYGKLYGTVFNKGLTPNVMTEAYVANGTRLPDSLAGGQLSHGPIMLVRDSTDIPAFTKDVATHLQCWNNGGTIGVAALGGKGVVSDETLKTVISLINTTSACGTIKSTTVDNKIMISDLPTDLKKGDALTADKVITIKYADGTPVAAGATVDKVGAACAGLTVESPTTAAGKATVAKNGDTPTADGKCSVRVDDGKGKYTTADITVAP